MTTLPGVFTSTAGLQTLREWDVDANLFVNQSFYNETFTAIISPYYDGFDADVDGDKIVLLAFSSSTNDLTFWWINPADGSVDHSVAMDPAYGGYTEGGEILFSGVQQLPMVLHDGIFTIIFGTGAGASSYRIIQFDATTGAMVTDQTVSTGDTADSFTSYAVHRAAGGFWFVRRNRDTNIQRVFHVGFDGSGHVDLGTLTGLSWTVSDIDTQMDDSTWIAISEGNDIVDLYGIAEHPNGNLLLVGMRATVAEVVPATGVVVNIVKPDHFAGRYSLGVSVEADGEHIWLTNQTTPDNMGLASSDGNPGDAFLDWTGRFDYDGNLLAYWGGTQSGNPFFLKQIPAFSVEPAFLVRSVVDVAAASDVVERSIRAQPAPVPTPPPPPPTVLPSQAPTPITNDVVRKARKRRSPIRSTRARSVNPWGSDVPVSRPLANNLPVVKDFGGFALTTGGIAHNVSDEQIEEMLTPTFSPSPAPIED